MNALLLALTLLGGSLGFDPPETKAGPLHMRIEGPPTIVEEEVTISVAVSNESPGDCRGTVSLQATDGWVATPGDPQLFEIEGGQTVSLPFSLQLAEETFNALYPLRAHFESNAGAKRYSGDAVLLIAVELPNPPIPERELPWEPQRLSSNGQAGLWRSPIRRTSIQLFNEPETRTMPVGWAGTEAYTKADVRFDEPVFLGKERRAIRMHPPWWAGRAGVVYTDYPLRLPDAPIALRFGYGIAPNTPEEPPSDGVTFRVSVRPFTGGDVETLFETHSDAKTWQSAEVDLSAHGGQSVLLRFEVDPGPAHDTTCDRACWAEPTLWMGDVERSEASRVSISTGRRLGEVHVDGEAYTVLLWRNGAGRPGCRIGFAREGELIWTEGLELTVDGDRVDQVGSMMSLVDASESATESGVCFDYALSHWSGPLRVRIEYEVLPDAVRIHCSLPEAPADGPWSAVRIDDVSLGPWSAPVQAVHAGVGNILVEPEAFTLGFDGHQLATSYVGHRFSADWAVVQGVDVPPTWYEFSPDSLRATLHTAHEQTITLVPGRNVWDAARVWRALDGREASGGFGALAGRFVFDLWGGRYATACQDLERAFRYGLTDSAVVWHAWQRWGYDYRLPDIWPPNPALGTEAELRAMSDLCRENGVLFAPHDNYIDIYPDASCFSYDNVAFNADRTPTRAWFNEGRGAQSYRWRVDAIAPQLKANLARIREGLSPTAYFIDVWSSARPHAYWTRHGEFVDHVRTRDAWGEHFAWIRSFLGGAPQISESGHDQLIGWLDGAQCNHLRVDPDGRNFTWRVNCADAERIPWIDFAHHERFALHGAGYPGRYDEGLDPALHGVYSDDYISTEVLTGHPGMVSHAFSRDVVRKYWLTHDLMRALAGRAIADVRFAGDDIHRQHVRWSGGGDVYVNRGDTDWMVDGHRLPPYGFHAQVETEEGVVAAAIERLNGVIVEWARSPGSFYVDGRMPSASGPHVKGRVDTCFMGDAETLAIDMRWAVGRSIREDLIIFVHLVDEEGEIVMQGDHRPDPPMTEWDGEAHSIALVPLPDSVRPGQRYDLRVGFYDPVLGRFPHLAGARDDRRRVRLGSLRLTGDGDRVTGATWTAPEPWSDASLDRRNADARVVDFGGIATAGGIRLTRDASGVRVTPLPESLPCDVVLERDLAGEFTRVEAISEDGHRSVSEAAISDAGARSFTIDGDTFQYNLLP